MANPALIAKAAAIILTDEKAQKAVGWTLVAILPEMGEYLQNIPDADLVSMTRDFLIKRGVINKPISQRGGKTYYFSENEVYSLDKEPRLFPYEGRTKFGRFEVMGEACFNMNVWLKAVSQFKVGTTLTECIKIFLKTELVRRVPKEPSSIVRCFPDNHIGYLPRVASFSVCSTGSSWSLFDRLS